MALLWPETPDDKARASLRQALRKIRAFGWGDLEVQGDEVRAIVSTDVAEFDAALAGRDWETALSLYRPLLDGVLLDEITFNAWLEHKRAHYQACWRQAAIALLDVGKVPDVPHLLKDLLRADPLDEDAVQRLLGWHATRGSHVEGLKFYKAFRVALRNEFGVNPAPETAQLAEGLRREGDKPIFRLSSDLLRPPALVGRDDLWAELEHAYALGKVVYVVGNPGAGKSRFILDFARNKGSYFLINGRPGDEEITYQSLSRAARRVLGMVPPSTAPKWVTRVLQHLLPDLFASTVVSRSDPALQPQQLKEAFWWLVNEALERVGTVPSDDMQFADPASFEVYSLMIVRAVERHRADRARVIITARTGAWLDQNKPFILEQVAADIVTYLELPPLGLEDVAQLSGRYARARDPQDLLRLTGGNPQFLMEVFKALASDVGSAGLRASAPVKAVISARVGRLAPTAQRVLAAAAVLGQQVDLDTLSAVTDLGLGRLEPALLELERYQLFIDLHFVHDLIGEAVLESTPAATLSVLHAKAARALAERGARASVLRYHELRV